MITRRSLLAGLAASFISPALAELRRGPFRVGLLLLGPTRSSPNQSFWLDWIPQTLEELGYVEGKHFVFEERVAEGRYERLPDLAAELISLRPDVILVVNSVALMALFKAHCDIPVVFASAGIDLVKYGVVKSLPHPGGKFTGIVNYTEDLNPKRLQFLRELLPTAVRLAYFANPLGTTFSAKEVEPAATQLGFEPTRIEVRAAEDFPAAFDKAAELKADALFVSPDPLSFQNRKTIIRQCAERKLPAIHNFQIEAADGGLIAYGADMKAEYRTAAIYIDKILRGEKPSDLPIEQATKLLLAINLKTARLLGLEVPIVLLARADEVIE